MEVPGGTSNKIVVCLCELMGTAFLIIAVNWGHTSNGGLNTPVSVGLTVFGMAQIFGPISGGHFNPAVTMGMFIKELGQPTNNVSWGYNLIFAIGIIMCQLIGAILGVTIVSLGMSLSEVPGQTTIPASGAYITQLCPAGGCDDEGKYLSKVFWVEILMTFMFVSVVLQIVKHNGSADMPVNALAIGITLYTSISIAAGISGGCINPAVGTIQPAFMRVFNNAIYPDAPKTSLSYYPAYIFGPSIGGILAGVFSRFVNQAGIEKAENAKEFHAAQ